MKFGGHLMGVDRSHGEEDRHIKLTLEGYLDMAATSHRTKILVALKNVWLFVQRA